MSRCGEVLPDAGAQGGGGGDGGARRELAEEGAIEGAYVGLGFGGHDAGRAVRKDGENNRRGGMREEVRARENVIRVELEWRMFQLEKYVVNF